MNIQLNLYEVETLEYLLDKFIFQQQKRDLDYVLYHRIQTMIKMQRECYIEQLIDELKKQIKRGETPSAVALQRQESLSYANAAKLIEQAKAEVEHERRIAEYRKEMEK